MGQWALRFPWGGGGEKSLAALAWSKMLHPQQTGGKWRGVIVRPHHAPRTGHCFFLKIKSRYFAGFCGLKHVLCMSNLLGIFVLGHYVALYTQNNESGVILNTHFNHRAHASGTLVVYERGDGSCPPFLARWGI